MLWNHGHVDHLRTPGATIDIVAIPTTSTTFNAFR